VDDLVLPLTLALVTTGLASLALAAALSLIDGLIVRRRRSGR
jgi:hypothetical protein